MNTPIQSNTIIIPALSSKEKHDVYRNWQSKVKTQRIDHKTKHIISMCEPDKGDTEALTIFSYDFEKSIAEEKLTPQIIARNVRRQIEFAMNSFYPILYLICLQPKAEQGFLETKRGNTFYVWRERTSMLYGMSVYWSEEEPAYTDRHCGTPYLEFDAVPAGWTLYAFNMSTTLPTGRIFSAKQIDFSE